MMKSSLRLSEMMISSSSRIERTARARTEGAGRGTRASGSFSNQTQGLIRSSLFEGDEKREDKERGARVRGEALSTSNQTQSLIRYMMIEGRGALSSYKYRFKFQFPWFKVERSLSFLYGCGW